MFDEFWWCLGMRKYSVDIQNGSNTTERWLQSILCHLGRASDRSWRFRDCIDTTTRLWDPEKGLRSIGLKICRPCPGRALQSLQSPDFYCTGSAGAALLLLLHGPWCVFLLHADQVFKYGMADGLIVDTLCSRAFHGSLNAMHTVRHPSVHGCISAGMIWMRWWNKCQSSNATFLSRMGSAEQQRKVLAK